MCRWDDQLAKWLHANDPNGVGASGEFTLWHNLNHPSLLPGSHSLLRCSHVNSTIYTGKPQPRIIRERCKHACCACLHPTEIYCFFWWERSFLGDPQSSHYEGLPDAAAQAALMQRLRAQHPNKTIPEPSDFFISRHGYDKNTYGA